MSETAPSMKAQAGTEQVRIRLCGVAVVPDTSGALYLPASGTLVVADLHFEKGSAFAARGVHLPPYDTRSTLFRLQHLIDHYAPQTVVALGDSFHDGSAGKRICREDADVLRSLTASCRWIWITGNHDPEPPDNLGGEVVETHEEGPFLFRHIPANGLATGEIAGHLHPVATVASRGRRLRRRCFVSDGTRLVMPAFGAYTGGLGVTAEPFWKLFDAGQFTAWMIGRDRVYPVSSKRLTAAQ